MMLPLRERSSWRAKRRRQGNTAKQSSREWRIRGSAGRMRTKRRGNPPDARRGRTSKLVSVSGRRNLKNAGGTVVFTTAARQKDARAKNISMSGTLKARDVRRASRKIAKQVRPLIRKE